MTVQDEEGGVMEPVVLTKELICQWIREASALRVEVSQKQAELNRIDRRISAAQLIWKSEYPHDDISKWDCSLPTSIATDKPPAPKGAPSHE